MTDSRTPDRQEPTPQDTTEAALGKIERWLWNFEHGAKIPVGSPSHLPSGYWTYARDVALPALSTIRSELERLREERDAAGSMSGGSVMGNGEDGMYQPRTVGATPTQEYVMRVEAERNAALSQLAKYEAVVEAARRYVLEEANALGAKTIRTALASLTQEDTG